MHDGYTFYKVNLKSVVDVSLNCSLLNLEVCPLFFTVKILIHKSITCSYTSKCSNHDIDTVEVGFVNVTVFFQAPLVPQGTQVVNALAKQRSCIENILRACLGLPPENNMLLEHKLHHPLITFGDLPVPQNEIQMHNGVSVISGTADVPKQLVDKGHQHGLKNYTQG